MRPIDLIFVSLGGALGAPLRVAMDTWLSPEHAGAFPASTFVVNMLGSFALGILVMAVQQPESSRFMFLGAGLLGAFTTFSAFSIQMLRMIQTGAAAMAVGYAVASVVLGLAFAASGFEIGKRVAS